MKKLILFFVIFFISQSVFSADNRNSSISFDPLTFLGLVLGPDDDDIDDNDVVDFRNMWFCASINWETENQREMGFGLFLRGDRITITTNYRSFYNKERQSGFFWGLYGLIEWRRMYWFYDNNSELFVGTNFPFVGDNVYQSVGITGGFDTGFRFRALNVGITPYLGLGIPLFCCFGNLPREINTPKFMWRNIATRAINIGVKLDFFND